MRTTIRIVTGLVLCLAAAACAAQSVEFRGLYVDAFHPGIKNHEEVTQMVRVAKAARFNALLVQVRKRGDAYYNSTIEPRAGDIAPDYDPLADVIRQAHAAGLEVHAMVAVCEVAHKSYDLPENHVAKKHTEWLMVMKDGSTVQYEGKIFLDPCVPEVRNYLVAIAEEIARKYDVDGIHLEGCRYIRREAMYNKSVLEMYAKASGKADVPAYDDDGWCQWRRQQVTSLVKQMHDTLALARPTVRLSVSGMTPTPEAASTYCFQDWAGWMRDGLVDFVVPMLYTDSSAVLSQAVDLLKVKAGRHMYLGIGTFQLNAAKAMQHIQDARTAGMEGVVLFNYHYLVAGSLSVAKVSDLAAAFSQQAAPPVMPWRVQVGEGVQVR